jgi:zinc and cadmium transporter
MFVNILIACFAIMLASVSGVFFLGKVMSVWTDRNLKYLMSFSSGIFIVVVYQLGREALEHSTTLGIGAMLAGAIIIHLLSKLWPEFHHHHEKDLDHTHSLAGVRRILVSDGIHNIGDGVLVATAFMANTYLGIITAVSIFIHEVVQEISEFFLLREAGLSIPQALLQNFLTSGTILIGALLGALVSSTELITTVLLGFAGGAFLYILLIDLIPKSVKNVRHDKALVKHLAWGLIGLALITTVNSFLPHGHEGEEHLEHTNETRTL